MRTLIFAYGSNMLWSRLTYRVGSARFVSNGWMNDYTLKFQKHGVDGSGKADCVPFVGSQLHGIVVSVKIRDLHALDEWEGVGYGYWRRRETINTPSGTFVAWVYYATHNINNFLRPYDWYLHHVVEGAKFFELEPSYIEWLQGHRVWRDLDARRSWRENRFRLSMPERKPTPVEVQH